MKKSLQILSLSFFFALSTLNIRAVENEEDTPVENLLNKHNAEGTTNQGKDLKKNTSKIKRAVVFTTLALAVAGVSYWYYSKFYANAPDASNTTNHLTSLIEGLNNELNKKEGKAGTTISQDGATDPSNELNRWYAIIVNYSKKTDTVITDGNPHLSIRALTKAENFGLPKEKVKEIISNLEKGNYIEKIKDAANELAALYKLRGTDKPLKN